jgi:heme A synthase
MSFLYVFVVPFINNIIKMQYQQPNSQTYQQQQHQFIISVAILSLSVGSIHLLLVQEHAKESIWWGVVFLISGIAQIVFGMIIVFVKRPPANIIIYYIGSIGNALLIITFVLVRLITPPFSPEGTTIIELEPNGIITLIIEIVIVVLLMYIMRFREETKKIMK